MSENATLRYVHQDHLTGTSLATYVNGDQVGTTMKYLPFGSTRSGSVPTDKLFTGQRLDGTELYYYNARYYDPTIGRFISPDTIIPHPTNPQSFNRYSYCLNNPLKYVDPSGHYVFIKGMNLNDLGNADYMQLVRVFGSSEFQAYSAFRSSSKKARIMAESMERDSTHDVVIKSDSNMRYWAETNQEGDDFTITLRSEMFESYGIERWQQGNIIYDQVDSYILNTHPDYDYWSAAVCGGGNAIPGGKLAIVIGKWTYNGISAYYRVDKIHQTTWPEEFFNAAAGSIPGVGPFYGFFGELDRQQTQHDLLVAYYNEIGDSRGFYPFR